MRKILYSILLLALTVASALGSNKYVSTAGSDSNNGLTLETAWRHVYFTEGKIAPGDTVFIDSGYYWDDELIPDNGTVSNKTVYMGIVYPGNKIPFVSGGVPFADTWTVHSGNVWVNNQTRTGFNCWPGGSPSIFRSLAQRLANGSDSTVKVMSSLSAVNAPGRAFFDEGTSDWYIWPYNNENPNNNLIVWACRAPLNNGFDQPKRHFEVKNLHLRDGVYVVVLSSSNGGGTDSAYFYNCVFAHAQVQGANNPALVYSGNTYSPDIGSWQAGNVFRKCTFFDVRNDNNSTSHSGAGIASYASREMTIDSCTFIKCFGQGVGMKNGNYPDYDIDAVGNVIKNCIFIGGCHEMGVWMGEKSRACSSYANTFIEIGGPAVYFEGSQTDCGTNCANQPRSYYSHGGNVFIFNTIVRSHGFQYTRVRNTTEFGKNKVMYNIYYDRRRANPAIFENRAIYYGGEPELNNTLKDTVTISDYNMFYNLVGSDAITYYANNYYSTLSGTFTTDFATYQGLGGGHDQNSTINVNPNFNNPSANDFSRPGTNQEISPIVIGGKSFTLMGAWQPSSTPCEFLPAPTLVSPSDGATDQSQPITLDFSDISGATNYRVQYGTSSGFVGATISESATSTVNISGLVNGTVYYWRASGYDACGWGTWSASRTFTTACPTINAPSLSSPSDGASDLHQPITFDWSDVSNVLDYQIQIDNNSDYSSTSVDQVVASSTLNVNGLVEGTTYYWRVRSRDGCGYSVWTSSRTFSTYLPASGQDSILCIVASSANDARHYNVTNLGSAGTMQIAEFSLAIGNLGPEIAELYFNVPMSLQQNAPMDSLFGYLYCRASNANPSSFIIRGLKTGNSAIYVDGTAGVTDVNARTKTTASVTWNLSSVTAGQWYRTPNLVTIFDEINSLYPIESFGLYIANNANSSDRWAGFGSYDFSTASYGNNSIAPRVDAYLTANSTPTVPTLVSPNNSSTINLTLPTFVWNNSTDADGNTITYNIDISTASNFSSIVETANGVPQGVSTTSWQSSVPLSHGVTYYWRVRSYDGLLFSEYSTTRSFSVSIAFKPPLKKKVGKR